MRIKKAGILIIAAAITCTTPAVPAMAADTSESVQEIISDNEIDSLVSDPDKVVDIIMYVKNEAAKQDISDDQIRYGFRRRKKSLFSFSFCSSVASL